ncbi:MarR family transcriptional regulator [Actinoallomurus oryzae]|jgi:DNA-binding MarR family transcriptional regulator|uniref:MarR family transcriptional regulator n=1 Tax=Actinoallomurus oryzae TaxID=502180 RepID=A0ABP8QSI1_9ACTN
MTEGITAVREHEAYQAVEHELGVLFRRARALSTEVAREVHPELEPAAYGLLIGMHDCARSRPSDLADYFGVGKPTISRQVKVLEQLGLIERRPDPDDGRAHLLVLTDEGRRRVEIARAARQNRFHAMLATWPAEDVRVLGRMLARFNDLAESRACHI